jgi:diacylglycerol kinase (CTP)
MEDNNVTPLREEPESSTEAESQDEQITATRSSLQLPRRMVHMSMGITVAVVYHFFLTHERAIYILGISASLVYIIEQFRTSYPEYMQKFDVIFKHIFRAEEQLKESAGVPYIMALLLTILTFPKPISLCAILTLAVADPLSAIVGIKYGKHKWAVKKSIEGSAAFFASTFIIILSIMLHFTTIYWGWTLLLAFSASFIISAFELIPLRVDDNLTIPLFTAFTIWILGALLGITF